MIWGGLEANLNRPHLRYFVLPGTLVSSPRAHQQGCIPLFISQPRSLPSNNRRLSREDWEQFSQDFLENREKWSGNDNKESKRESWPTSRPRVHRVWRSRQPLLEKVGGREGHSDVLCTQAGFHYSEMAKKMLKRKHKTAWTCEQLWLTQRPREIYYHS